MIYSEGILHKFWLNLICFASVLQRRLKMDWRRIQRLFGIWKLTEDGSLDKNPWSFEDLWSFVATLSWTWWAPSVAPFLQQPSFPRYTPLRYVCCSYTPYFEPLNPSLLECIAPTLVWACKYLLWKCQITIAII